MHLANKESGKQKEIISRKKAMTNKKFWTTIKPFLTSKRHFFKRFYYY